MTSLIFLIGLLVAVLAVWLMYPTKERRAGIVSRMYSVENDTNNAEAAPKSLEIRLAAAGVGMKPTTFRLLRVAVSAAAFVVGSAVLPGLPALTLAVLSWYSMGAWLDGKAKNRGREIDKRLPIAVGRIAAGLLAGGSVDNVLEEVASSLEMEGANPLSPELHQTAAEMKTKDRREALLAMAERSPSVSLSNLSLLLEGYLEAGGGAYADVLMDISQRVQQILVARGRAQAKAGDVLLSTRTLPIVLFLVLGYLSADPAMGASLRSFPVQIVLGLVIGMMVFGYFIMQSMVQEAV